MFWPVGDFHDDTTRLLGGALDGFSSADDAQTVIDDVLKQQRKPHHVSYRVAEYPTLAALQANGVLV